MQSVTFLGENALSADVDAVPQTSAMTPSQPASTGCVAPVTSPQSSRPPPLQPPFSVNTRTETEDRQTNAAEVDDAAGTDVGLTTTMDVPLPYVSRPRVLWCHMAGRVILLILSALIFVCCVLSMAFPLCELDGVMTVYKCSVTSTPSMWLSEANASFIDVGGAGAALRSDQDTSHLFSTLTLIQVGVLGALTCAALCLLFASVFLFHRWYMESSRRRDSYDANRRTHRLSAVVFTRREITRRRADRAVGWALAVPSIAMLVFTLLGMVGLIRMSASPPFVEDVSGRQLSPTDKSAAAAVAVGFVLSFVHIICTFVPWLSDFHPGPIRVTPVHFAEVSELDMTETAQSRAIREEVRRQREEAAIRANTVRGLTLEQSMPPSPWSMSVYSYMNRSHSTVIRDGAENSVVWRLSSVTAFPTGHLSQSRSQRQGPGHRSSGPQELSLMGDNAKFNPAHCTGADTEMRASEANGTAYDADAWLITADAADNGDRARDDVLLQSPSAQGKTKSSVGGPHEAPVPRTHVRSPRLPPSLRKYLDETTKEAMQSNMPGTASFASSAPRLPRVLHDGQLPGAGGDTRKASVEDLSAGASHSTNLNSSAGASPGAIPLTSFSVGWRNAPSSTGGMAGAAGSRARNAPDRRLSGGAGGAAARDYENSKGDGFTEFLCVAAPAPPISATRHASRRRTSRFTVECGAEDAGDAPAVTIAEGVSVGPARGAMATTAAPAGPVDTKEQTSSPQAPARDTTQTTATFRAAAQAAREGGVERRARLRSTSVSASHTSQEDNKPASEANVNPLSLQ